MFDAKGHTEGHSESGAAEQSSAPAATPRPSRRTVVRGAAWATPVVLVAAAAPTVAASVTVALKLTGSGCKLPGNSNDLVKGYVFGITILNSGTVAADIVLTSIKIDGDSLGVNEVLIQDADSCAIVGSQFQVAAGSPRNIALYTRNYTKSQAGTLTLTYTYDPVGPSPAVTPPAITATVTGSTWNGGCRPFPTYSCGLPHA
ncbi:hypothetical protein [Intrasporangium flavum]|uniref:hypothetical protein n=1 Tax=Intrasporangium flavum TaxID=1428657 RepID=UPI001A95C129|nr:hypothetical protein [Intrasporangium flavum]